MKIIVTSRHRPGTQSKHYTDSKGRVWTLECITDKVEIKDGYIMFHANNRDYRLYEMFFNFEIED